MTNILFIHQSAELYGSDKTLLLLLSKLDKSRFKAVVVIPFDGPLKFELEKENIKVVIAPVLKLYRKMFTPKNILLFFKQVKKSVSILDELNKEHQFDLVYSNTLAVLLGMVYARKRGIKHIWHVHEIIESPKIFTVLFRVFLENKANTKIVYNSIATQIFWNKSEPLLNKSQVISNGLDIQKKLFSDEERDEIRNRLFQANQNDIVIVLVGRISRWKGQLILLKVFYELSKSQKDIKLVFVGSAPPNQEMFSEKLKQQIEEYKISQKVAIIPFQEEIYKIWESVDIAVVPSTEPEPFGLVAVEAMLAKKPVIASNHGGLTEIVVHDETGFLVEPNNEKALFEAIAILIANPDLRKTFGENGYERAINEFSAYKHVQKFEELFKKMILHQ